MKNQVYVIGLIASLATIYTACQDDSGSMRRKKFFGANGSGEMTTVDVEAAPSGEDALGLTDDVQLGLTNDAQLALAGQAVKSMKVKVSCDNVAEEIVEDNQFDLPVGATNCKAKLVAIKIGDKNYVEPVGGSGFTHYLAKDTGKLANEADAKDILFVKVKQQLPSPLKANSGVQYVYSNLTQFDSVEIADGRIDETIKPKEVSASPKVKVSRAFFGPYGGLNVVIQCTDAAGYVGTDKNSLKCGDVDVSKMKYAIAKQPEKALTNAEIEKLIQESQFQDKKDLHDSYSPTEKTLKLNFGEKAKQTYVFVVRLTEAGKSPGYSYGFLKMNAVATAAVTTCPAQGDQANFVQHSLQGSNKSAFWKDTSNCWIWARSDTKKVKKAERFKQCAAVTVGANLEHPTVPYAAELKDARDRKLMEIAKGPAPKLGEDLDKTFWTASGRVFNAADGSVREAEKGAEKTEVHGVLCVLRRD